MKKSIYDVYVTVTSQEQADRLKTICLEFGLPISPYLGAFEFEKGFREMYVRIQLKDKWFFVSYRKADKTQITESEFEKLAKEFKQ
jgi:hypothetical protein